MKDFDTGPEKQVKARPLPSSPLRGRRLIGSLRSINATNHFAMRSL